MFKVKPVVLALSMAVVLSVTAFGSDTPLAEVFSESGAGSTIELDHSSWAEILEKYLDNRDPGGINLFDYAGVSPGDQTRLRSYLQYLQAQDPGLLDRDEQMAYWINFYNALTVSTILDHYPVDSIRDITFPGSRSGPWKAEMVTVNGIDLSLDDIEHRILRPIWRDPRIHYAVNCASLGCPNLMPVPYTGSNLESMLDEAARSFINHPRGVTLQGGRIQLSSIYKWYAEDFGDKEGLRRHLSEYADSERVEVLSNWNGRLRYAYDWRLNMP